MSTTVNPIRGFDIYHGDGPLQFHPFVDAGFKFVFLKSTQGATEVDPAFDDFRKRAHDVGLLVGAYHFFDPLANPITQADNFIKTARPVAGEMVMTLDVETGGVHDGANARTAAQRIKDVTGYYPIIYSSNAFYLQYLKGSFPADAFTLWIARYSLKPSVGGYAFWQDSETGRIPGVAHAIDTDWYMGSLQDLKDKHTVK